MMLKTIPIAVTITLFLVNDTNSKGIPRTSDFSKEYLKDMGYDNINDIEMPMVEDANPGEVAVIMMKNEPSPTPEVPIIKPPERTFPIIPVQEPIKGLANIDLTMGEVSDTSSSSDLSESGLELEDIENITDNNDDGKIQVLRKALRSCSKKAYKRCTKACKAAYKITCAEYFCSRRRKKAFKRSCKTNCRMNFM